jgi:hypothetical protein
MRADPSSRGSNFFVRPSTKLGRAAAGLFVVGLVVYAATLLLTLNTAGTPRPSAAVAAILLAGFAGALVTGAVALIGYHERSWAVGVATLLPALIVAADVVAGLLGPSGREPAKVRHVTAPAPYRASPGGGITRFR